MTEPQQSGLRPELVDVNDILLDQTNVLAGRRHPFSQDSANFRAAAQPAKKPTKASERAYTTLVREVCPNLRTENTALVEKLSDRVAYMEERIEHFARAVEAEVSCLPDNAVNVASQEPLWYVGRICTTGEGRLTHDSVILEGSIAFSQGNRVSLDISQLRSCRLFVGQLIAVEGINPTGERLIARRIVDAIPDSSAHYRSIQARPDNGDCSLSMTVASGPYTAADNLEYEPLSNLLAMCATSRPDLLLLLGPFVDAEHPFIKGCVTEEPFKQLFEQKVLRQCQKAGAAQVVLIPSSRDVHQLDTCYESCQPGQPPISIMQNPSTFICRNTSVGVCTADFLRHISSQEIQQGSNESDRIAALASHILKQGSYYPLFPPPKELMLENTLSHAFQLPLIPNVLLVPSDLNSFTKILPVSQSSTTVCTNPGRLVKGGVVGTFAHIRVDGSEAKVNQTGTGLLNFSKVCTVELQKLYPPQSLEETREDVN